MSLCYEAALDGKGRHLRPQTCSCRQRKLAGNANNLASSEADLNATGVICLEEALRGKPVAVFTQELWAAPTVVGASSMDVL